MNNNPLYMHKAIDHTRLHIAKNEGGPFGACIVKNDRVITINHNTVLKEGDATCHAEINAIRAASALFKTHDLSQCEIYSTTEPCPMCFSAIHWANISKIIYGTSIQDVQALGFKELCISNLKLKQLAHSNITLVANYMQAECQTLLDQWRLKSNGITY